ncbi:uncharacterized protein SPPG_00285 [Spizellomyces punctatus DAOM BR117]|uniref:Asparagine synthetase domain-containing protein n=1 Tax=Spizellomyces punctatus (strain DAOM BR117) TaxID=645134 RepID=A0A0L0HUN6_SPIPD|nr:uncharacterized protein SPPG_00285 [Spizellomyces punctatus DAOM BR117]KND04564.1 hypothetical protein SPPG_00285 [Spizellomyces punctatus DAOM BR117]|eukprot:XP_016612603.1 hypothetical protein SPPG_00285 [Spizellomyces punctatus DAOM BR117]
MDTRAAELRSLFLSVLSSSSDNVDGILLSGGLDTSIIADAGTSILGLTTGVTVVCGESGTSPDEPYATSIAKANKLSHRIVRVPDPLDLVDDAPGGLLDLCVRTLCTFDPMELRNAVVIARGLKECQNAGLRVVVTGDGADELFAGYSFLASMQPGKLKRYIRRLAQPNAMRFCAGPLAKALGLDVVQPYLDPRIIEFALTCRKQELVGTDEGGMMHGKWILREAFPEAHSRWRKKDPIEVGSGTTVLPKVFEKRCDEIKVEQEIQDIAHRDRIKIRDAEHLHYYRAFQRAFALPSKNDQPTQFNCPVARYASDPCRACGFQLQRADQFFCVVCGEWPARDGGPPTDDQEGDELDI